MAITKLSDSGIATGGVLKYDSMLAGNPAYIPSAWESIATITATTNTSEFAFTGIPQTYKNLHIRGIVRQSTSEHGYGYLYIQVNSTGGYNNSLWATSTSIQYTTNGSGYIQVPVGLAGSDNSANTYGALMVDLHAYNQTNTFKSGLAMGGMTSNGTGTYQGVGLASFASSATAAVTALYVFSPFGAPMVAGSSVALYGLKG